MDIIQEVFKVVLGSPLLSGVVLNAIGRTYIAIAGKLNTSALPANDATYVHWAYLAVSALYAVLTAYQNHTLPTDSTVVQNAINLYANTLMLHLASDKTLAAHAHYSKLFARLEGDK
jgi:hypothetical protein